MSLPKIYFCGSIRGGAQDAHLYSEIINHLQSSFGPVLTEHVGDPLRTAQMQHTEEEIWIQVRIMHHHHHQYKANLGIFIRTWHG